METLKIPIATKNVHKVEEANEVLREFNVKLVPVDVEKIEIQSDSLEDIARFAAVNAFKRFRKPILVEDSGLFIEALNGFPGPYSSYVYRTIGLDGILRLMKGISNRRAMFVCVVAFALSENEVYIFKGIVRGTISEQIRGSKGFGFDPIFIPEGFNKTFGEMDRKEKTAISHRGKAFRAFGEWISKYRDKLIHSL